MEEIAVHCRVKSLKSEIEIFGFSDNVNIQIDQEYSKLGDIICRGENRKRMIFSCIYQAHETLGISLNTEQLLSISNTLGISFKKLSKARTMFNSNVDKVIIRKYNVFIRNHCSKLGYEETVIQDMITFSENIVCYLENVDDWDSKILAVSLIFYYCYIFNIPVTLRDLCRSNCVNEKNVDTYINEIGKIYISNAVKQDIPS